MDGRGCDSDGGNVDDVHAEIRHSVKKRLLDKWYNTVLFWDLDFDFGGGGKKKKRRRRWSY